MRSWLRHDQDTSQASNLSFSELRALSDEDLIVHLRAGRGDALTVLFDRYHRLVLHVALKIVRDVGEAEDVMQSVFMEIFKVAEQFDPERGNMKAWMLRYAYHRSMNRRKQLQARHFYTTAELEAVEDTVLSGPLGSAGLHEARQMIDRGLQALSPVQKRVLHLAYFEGMTMKEIATQTGETVGNVRHYYYRGLDKLRAHLLGDGQASEVGIPHREMGRAKA